MKRKGLARAAVVALALVLAPFLAREAAGAEPESLPVPALTIYPGDTILESMLTDRKFTAGTAANFAVLAAHADLVGKVARRTLLPGRLIARNAIGEPQLVSQGTIIRAVYQSDGLVITATVLALQSGSQDALIQVRNIDSGKVIVGAVQADGTVRVDGE